MKLSMERVEKRKMPSVPPKANTDRMNEDGMKSRNPVITTVFPSARCIAGNLYSSLKKISMLVRTIRNGAVITCAYKPKGKKPSNNSSFPARNPRLKSGLK